MIYLPHLCWIYHHETAGAGKSGLQSVCTRLGPSLITAVNEYRCSTWLLHLLNNTNAPCLLLCSCHQARRVINYKGIQDQFLSPWNPKSGPHLLGCYWIGAPGLSPPAPAAFYAGSSVCTAGHKLHSRGGQSEAGQMPLRKDPWYIGVRRLFPVLFLKSAAVSEGFATFWNVHQSLKCQLKN